MEIGYGGDNEALPEETGRNRRIKLPPVATAPSLYSEVNIFYFAKFVSWREKWIIYGL